MFLFDTHNSQIRLPNPSPWKNWGHPLISRLLAISSLISLREVAPGPPAQVPGRISDVAVPGKVWEHGAQAWSVQRIPGDSSVSSALFICIFSSGLPAAGFLAEDSGVGPRNRTNPKSDKSFNLPELFEGVKCLWIRGTSRCNLFSFAKRV